MNKIYECKNNSKLFHDKSFTMHETFHAENVFHEFEELF